MAALYTDSSALAKRYIVEIGSTWLHGLVNPATGNEVYTVRLTAAELIAAITRRERGGTLSTTDAARARADFRHDLAVGYFLVEATENLVNAAMALSETHGLRGYDAVQLAAGLEVNRLYVSAGSAPILFVSADTELNAAAMVEGLLVDNPNAHP